MAELAELNPILEILVSAGACFSALVGLILRALRPQSRFEASAGVPDKATMWLGAALGLLVLLLLLPWLYL